MEVYLKGLKGSCREFFERLIQFDELNTAEIDFNGVWSKDPKKIEQAKAFESHHSTEMDFYREAENFYQNATKDDLPIIVDPYVWLETTEAGRHGIKHIRKYPIQTRSQNSALNIRNRYLLENKYDHIPAASRIRELFETRDVEEINIHLADSRGLEKTFKTSEMMHYRGDIVSNKLLEAMFLLNYITEENEFKLSQEKNLKFLPRGLTDSDLFELEGGKAVNLEEGAIAKGEFVFEKEGFDTNVNLSMVGVDKRVDPAHEVQRKFDNNPIEESLIRADGDSVVRRDKLELIEIKANERYVADLLNNKVYNMESERVVKTPSNEFQPIIQSLRDILLQEAGKRKSKPCPETTQRILQIREDVSSEINNNDRKYMDEVERGQENLKKKLMKQEATI